MSEKQNLYKKKKSKKQNSPHFSINSRRIPISFSSDNLHSYGSINNSNDDTHLQASVSRYRYYSRLGMPIMPDHIVPSKFFVLIPLVSQIPGTQKSIITIFAIWNTMMGTSLLSIPWVFQQSGFALGLVLMLLVATLAFYTVYLVLKSTEQIPIDSDRVLFTPDFTDACKYYLGRPAEILAMVFSFLALLGALIVYYVLLCDFLYSSVSYIFHYADGEMVVQPSVILHNKSLNDVVCPLFDSFPTHNASFYPTIPATGAQIRNLYSSKFISNSLKPFNILTNGINQHNKSSDSIFLQMWQKQFTVPFWLLILVFPLVCIRSPTFFTKFNALGTVSIVYLAFLVIMKATEWGINMDFTATEYPDYIKNASSGFPVLTGVGMLAFFIHNSIHSIVRNQAKPQNNIRDLLIAYICVALTYIGIGLLFYSAFPFPKDCLQQNFLTNLGTNDILAFVARIALFLQMMTVYPLLMYILRSQFMYFFFKSFYPSWIHVLILHFVLLSVCVCFAVFIPHIGEIIRFSGSLCGLVYMLTLPCLVKIKMIRSDPKRGKSTIAISFHFFLIFLGLLNFIGQFLPFIIP